MLASNFPAASLKALGEVVAKERSWAVVWVDIEVAVVDIVGGGGDDELLDKRREMVGSKTPNSLGPKQRNAVHTRKIHQKVKQKTYDTLPK